MRNYYDMESHMYLRLIRTDLKRISTYGVYLVITAVIMMTLFLCLAANADRLLYSENSSQPLKIGIVMSADSSLAEFAYKTVAGMESYKSECSFIPLEDRDTALSMLEAGELFAAIYVPDNIITDIIDGTNTPVEVYYSDYESIDSFVLNDLFCSTSSMLGISQAAIYSVQAFGREKGLSDEVQANLSDEINGFFMQRVLDRASTYSITEINATRSQGITSFYVSAAVIVMMSLCGIVFIPFRLSVPSVYRDKLKMCGVGQAGQAFSSLISIFVWEYLLYLSTYLALTVLSLLRPDMSIHPTLLKVLLGIPIAFAIALLILAVSMIPAGVFGCTLLLAVTAVILSYLSGFFIPETMLPNFAKAVCHISIFNRFAQLLCG